MGLMIYPKISHMLINISHVMLINITHVMLINISHVMLINSGNINNKIGRFIIAVQFKNTGKDETDHVNS